MGLVAGQERAVDLRSWIRRMESLGAELDLACSSLIFIASCIATKELNMDIWICWNLVGDNTVIYLLIIIINIFQVLTLI